MAHSLLVRSLRGLGGVTTTDDTAAADSAGVAMWQMHDMGSGWWLVMAVMLVAFAALATWLVRNNQRSDGSTVRSAVASQRETATQRRGSGCGTAAQSESAPAGHRPKTTMLTTAVWLELWSCPRPCR